MHRPGEPGTRGGGMLEGLRHLMAGSGEEDPGTGGFSLSCD